MHPRETAFRNRWRLSEYIARHEPLSGDELRGAMRWEFQEFFDAVNSWPDRWFMLTVRGWELTGECRERLAASIRNHHGSNTEDTQRTFI